MEKKYILTDEVKFVCAYKLHRIKAVKDFNNVKAGDLGGWIESEENLSHEGLCWVGGEACVFQNARVFENARVYGDARVYGSAQVYEQAWVSEYAWVHGYARVFGNTWVHGNARVIENVQLYGDARLYGDAQISGDAQVSENAMVYGDARVFGDAQVTGYAHVNGNARISRNSFIRRTEDYLCISPIGSLNDLITFYKTGDQKIWVSCGCFEGSIETFVENVKVLYEGTPNEKEYLTAILLARMKF